MTTFYTYTKHKVFNFADLSKSRQAIIHTVAAFLLLERQFGKASDGGCCSSTPLSIGVKLISFEASPEEYCIELPPAANFKTNFTYN